VPSVERVVLACPAQAIKGEMHGANSRAALDTPPLDAGEKGQTSTTKEKTA